MENIYRKVFLLVISFYGGNFVNGQLIIHQSNANSKISLLSGATIAAIENFYLKFYADIVFEKCKNSRVAHQFQNSIFDEIIPRLRHDIPFYLKTHDVKLTKTKRLLFVSLIDNIKDLNLLTRNPQDHRKNYFLLIYTGHSKDYRKIIRGIFMHFLHWKILNVNFLVQLGNEVKFFTYFPFGDRYCNNTTPKIINIFNGQKLLRKTRIFPSKLNMYGCPLRIAVISSPDRKSLQTVQKLDEVEKLLLQTLSKRLNFTISMSSTSIELSVNDALTIVSNDSATLAIGGLIAVKETSNNYITQSIPYTNLPVLAVLLQGSKLSSFERIKKPFQDNLWLSLGVTIMIGSIAIILITKIGSENLQNCVFGDRNRNAIFNMWKILCGDSLIRLPRKNFARYLLMLWIIFTFIIRRSYEGQSYSALMDSKIRTNYRNVDDLIRDNFTFFITSNIFKIVEKSFPNKSNLIEIFDLQQTIDNQLKKKKEKIAILCLKPKFLSMNISQAKIQLLLLPERFMYVSMCISYKNNSNIKDIIDEEINQYREAGLIHLWESNMLRNIRNNPHFIERKHNLVDFYIFRGILRVFLTILIVPAVVLILEVLSMRYSRVKRFCDFFTY